MRVKFIDGLRALAIIDVAMSHAHLKYSSGVLGVTVFFTISGYVIVRLMLNEYASTGSFRLKAFFVRRGLKIIPPFLAVVTALSVVGWRTQDLSWTAVLSQHLFAYNWWVLAHNDPHAGVFSGTQVVWTLSVEEQFYIGVALLWLALVRFTRRSIGSFATIMVGIYTLSTAIRLYVSDFTPDSSKDFWRLFILQATPSRISSIALGGLVALIVHDQGQATSTGRARRIATLLSHNLRTPLTIAAVSMLIWPLVVPRHLHSLATDIVLYETATALLILVGVVGGGLPQLLESFLCSSPLQRIGLASYSIYLTHLVIIFWLTRTMGIADDTWARQLLIVAACLVPGLIIHRWVDMPMERYRARWRLPSAPALSSDTTQK